MDVTEKSQVSPAVVGVGQGSKPTERPVPAPLPNSLPAPIQPPASKIVRLKLTKPKRARKDPQDVDWDEDLRPTPGEEAEAQKAHGGATRAQTEPKKGKTAAKQGNQKRAKISKPRTTSAKRRKSNSTKSNTAKRGIKISQLPLTTVATSALVAPIDKEIPCVPDEPSNQCNVTTETKVDLPKTSHKTSLPKDDYNKIIKNSPRVSVEIRSSPSITGDSSLGFDYDIKEHSQMVSILEHRAQLEAQKKAGKSGRIISETDSISSRDAKNPASGSASKLTILQSRVLHKQKIRKSKVACVEKSLKSHKSHGRAQSVGSKLMLALHGEDSQHGPVFNRDAPIIISSDPVEPQKSPESKQPDPMPTQTMPTPHGIEKVQKHAVRVDSPHHSSKSDKVRSSSPVVVDDTKEVELVDATGGMASWGAFLSSLGHSEGPSTEDSSDIEMGRGLIDDEPSILDYHMEMEHLSGFETLQPMIHEPTTHLQPTKPGESPKSTSSGTSITRKTDIPPAGGNKKHESSHTPESQKPLLRSEAEHRSLSPQQTSAPRTIVVDRNGSPQLVSLSIKGVTPFQVDFDGEQDQEVATSSSQYDRSSSEFSTASQYKGVFWTKFQREMFLAYGIDTEKMDRSHTWPPQPMPKLSCSKEDTADGADSDKESTSGPDSSQRTIEERGLGVAQDRQCDRSFRTDISVSSQPDMKSHRSSEEDPMNWISTLRVAQKDAHNLLHQTNSNLSTQLAAEKATITRVLEIYREGCGRILEDLFQAQEARMTLYKQQMQHVKEQHTEICQDLVRGLQELDRRMQQGPI
ncbi:uncharacterized protein MYU51_005739 [Penicillium brevicompactum]|uniref:uncharacterized protein n=1 Tax=Penicillium brevicompactum TaxID=5074 RepID=UPI0025407DA7|nr:uncharacterized protein N7506_004702 [Penicillium brevicompactum]KAJ5336680.1 hypothetical protein N7506_004702 [Penicillium brevicompactum]